MRMLPWTERIREGGGGLILSRIMGLERERLERDKRGYRNRKQAIGSCDPHDYLVLVGGSKIGSLIAAERREKEEEGGQRESSHWIGCMRLREWEREVE